MQRYNCRGEQTGSSEGIKSEWGHTVVDVVHEGATAAVGEEVARLAQRLTAHGRVDERRVVATGELGRAVPPLGV